MEMFEYESGKLQPNRAGWAPLKLILCVLMFASWCIATAIGIRTVLRQTPEFQLADSIYYTKMLAYQELETTPDVVFVGSSRIQLHVNSAEIQDAAQQYGCENLKVFNLGVGGGIASNAQFMVDWLLAQDKKPKKIYFEPKGAEWYGRLPTKRNFFLTPYWPNKLWQHHFYSYERRDNPDIPPLMSNFDILKRSLKVFFNFGALQLLYDGETSRPEFEQTGIDGFRGQEEGFSYASGGYRKYRRLLEKEPNLNGDKLTAYEKSLSGAPERAYAEIQQPAELILQAYKPEDLSRLGVIVPPPVRASQIHLDAFDFKNVTVPVITSPISELPVLDDPEMYGDPSHMWKDGHREYSRYIAKDVCESVRR